jgi:hypothetical protein
MAARRDGHSRTVCSKVCAVIYRARAQRAKGMREVDQAVVDRLIHGGRVSSVKSERLNATQVLDHSGHSAAFIAECLHVAEWTVRRYRHELAGAQS